MKTLLKDWPLFVALTVFLTMIVFGVMSISYGMDKSRVTWDRCEKAGGEMHKVDFVYKCIKGGTEVAL